MENKNIDNNLLRYLSQANLSKVEYFSRESEYGYTVHLEAGYTFDGERVSSFEVPTIKEAIDDIRGAYYDMEAYEQTMGLGEWSTPVEPEISDEVNEVVNELGFISLEQLNNKSSSYTRPLDFGKYIEVPSINERSLFISPLDYLNGNSDDCIDYTTLDDVDRLRELLGNYDVINYRGDNTYNHGGYIANDLNYNVFTSELDESVIVAYRVHIGLDVRAGYTNATWIQYDTEHDLLEHLVTRFSPPINAEYMDKDGDTHHISISYEISNEYSNIYIHGVDCDIETYELDFYDLDDFRESLENILNDNNVEYHNLTIESDNERK